MGLLAEVCVVCSMKLAMLKGVCEFAEYRYGRGDIWERSCPVTSLDLDCCERDVEKERLKLRLALRKEG